jgi:hypothetical protein
MRNGYHVFKVQLCDAKDLGRPANRIRAFGIMSRVAPAVQIDVAFAAAMDRAKAAAAWGWLEDVFVTLEDLARYLRTHASFHLFAVPVGHYFGAPAPG